MIQSIGISIRVKLYDIKNPIIAEWGRKYNFYKPLTVFDAKKEYTKIKKILSAELKSYDYVKHFEITSIKHYSIKEKNAEIY